MQIDYQTSGQLSNWNTQFIKEDQEMWQAVYAGGLVPPAV